jgi:hypothetical protein
MHTGYLAMQGNTQVVNGVRIANPGGAYYYNYQNRTCFTRENYSGSWRLTAYPPDFPTRYPDYMQPDVIHT